MPPDAAGVAHQPTSGSRLRVIGGEFIRYGLCSALALGCDYGLLLLLHHVFGVHYQVAAVAGFSAGIVVVYLTSTRFAFRNRRLESRSLEFAGFLVVGLLGLALTVALLQVFVEGLDVPVAIAKIPTTGIVFLFNFLVRRIMLFTARSPS